MRRARAGCGHARRARREANVNPSFAHAAAAPQALAALKAKAGEKGTFGGKGLSYSGKK